MHTSSHGITSLAFFTFVLCDIQTTSRYYKNSTYLMVNWFFNEMLKFSVSLCNVEIDIHLHIYDDDVFVSTLDK